MDPAILSCNINLAGNQPVAVTPTMAHDTQWTDHLIRKSVEKLAPYAASAETRSTRKALTKLETKELIEAAASIEHAIKLTTSIPPPLALDLSLPKLLFQTVRYKYL